MGAFLQEKPELFEPINELLFTFLLKPHNMDLVAELTTFATSHRVKPVIVKNSARALLYYFQSALRSSIVASKVGEDMLRLGFTAEQAAFVAAKWKENFIGLSRMVVNTTLDVNAVVDMDWRFGVTAASSELSQVGSTFLQLKLTVDKGNNVREDVFMELSLDQFFRFLVEMEKAKANLGFMS